MLLQAEATPGLVIGPHLEAGQQGFHQLLIVGQEAGIILCRRQVRQLQWVSHCSRWTVTADAHAHKTAANVC